MKQSRVKINGKVTLGKIANTLDRLAIVSARSFASLDNKVNSLDNKINDMDKRLGRVEDKLGEIDSHFYEFYNHNAIIDKEIERLKKRVFPK